MKYEPYQFFKELKHDEVKGFTVLQAKDGKYHIAEKWFNDGEEDGTWLSYWISESDLLARVERAHCKPHATLTEKQYKSVCRNVGWRYDEGETPAQTA